MLQPRKKGTITPLKIKHISPDFPLLQTCDVYRPPEVLSTKGTMLTRVYETGFHCREKYLEEGSKITVIGTLKSKEGKFYVGPDTDNTYIITSLSLNDVKNKLKTLGGPELVATLFTFALGTGLIVAGSQQRRRNL